MTPSEPARQRLLEDQVEVGEVRRGAPWGQSEGGKQNMGRVEPEAGKVHMTSEPQRLQRWAPGQEVLKWGCRRQSEQKVSQGVGAEEQEAQSILPGASAGDCNN